MTREDLAQDIRNTQTGRRERGENVDYSELVTHALNRDYPNDKLLQELLANKMKWFAMKLQEGYYDDPKQIPETTQESES